MKAFFSSPKVLFFGLGAISLLVFGISLPNPFYFDDLILLQNNSWLHGLTPPLGWFGTFFMDSNQVFVGYRPTLMVSFFANAELFGTSPMSFRFGNLLIHTLNSFLWAMCVSRLRKPEKIDSIVWGCGLLFLLHPIQTLPINFLWKRSSLMMVFFLFSSLWLHIGERQRNPVYSKRSFFLQGILFFLALTSKEEALIFPLLLGAVDLCFFKEQLRHPRNILFYGLWIGLGLGFLWFRFFFVSQQVGMVPIENRRLLSTFDYWISSLSVFPDYFRLWLVPRPLLLDDPLPLAYFPWNRLWIFFFLLLGSIGVILCFLRQPFLIFCLLVAWVGFLPFLSGGVSLFLVKDQIRMYLPLAGLSGVLVFFLSKALSPLRFGKAFYFVLGAIVLFYGTHSFIQNLRYRFPQKIWEDVLEEYPHSGLAWGALGATFESMHLSRAAANAYEEAQKVEPENHSFRVKALQCKLKTGTPKEVIRKELVGISPSKMDVVQWVNLSILEAEVGDYSAAQKLLLEALKIFPYNSLIHYTLGVVWERKGDFENARKAYMNAISLAPQDSNFREALQGLDQKSSREKRKKAS